MCQQNISHISFCNIYYAVVHIVAWGRSENISKRALSIFIDELFIHKN